jgi:hypothetical protein
LANKIGKALASYPAEIAGDALVEARVLEDAGRFSRLANREDTGLPKWTIKNHQEIKWKTYEQ